MGSLVDIHIVVRNQIRRENSSAGHVHGHQSHVQSEYGVNARKVSRRLSLQIVALTLNNKLDLHSLNLQDKTIEQLPSIEKSAHRSEVRCLAFSSDDMLIASGSAESLKIWNRSVEHWRMCSAVKIRPVLDIVLNRYGRFLVRMHFAACSCRVIIRC